jgi:hypothetical protein
MANKYWEGTGSTFQTATNWKSNAGISTGDKAIFTTGGSYGVAGSNAAALALGGFQVEEGYDQDIATKATYLQIDADTVELAGGGTIYLNVNRSTTVDVTKAAAAGTANTFGTVLTGGSNAALRAILGSNEALGIAPYAGESARFTAITISGSGTVAIGDAVTVTTLTIDGGTVTNKSGATTMTISDGTVTHTGGTVTTLNQYGGTLYVDSGDSITTLNAYDGFDLKLTRNVKGVTVGTLHIYGAGTVDDPYNKLTVANAIQYHGVDYEDVTWNRHPDFTITFGALP